MSFNQPKKEKNFDFKLNENYKYNIKIPDTSRSKINNNSYESHSKRKMLNKEDNKIYDNYEKKCPQTDSHVVENILISESKSCNYTLDNNCYKCDQIYQTIISSQTFKEDWLYSIEFVNKNLENKYLKFCGYST